jgi:hypothetical protein
MVDLEFAGAHALLQSAEGEPANLMNEA